MKAKKNNVKTVEKIENNTIDLTKIPEPEISGTENKKLLQTVIDLCLEQNKKNPKFPFIGVNEIADFLNEQNIFVTPRDVRRKLQNIRKTEPAYKEFEGKKAGKIVLFSVNKKNPLHKDLHMQWVDKQDRKKGIFYLISFID